MGVIYEANCSSCGYASGSLFAGPGMLKPYISHELARCEHCQEIILVRSSSVRLRCPKCRHKVQVINVRKRMMFDADSKVLECPKCRKITLKLAEVGLWD